ncbi:MAG: hypothetical protein ACRC7O_11005 [Fimbriiglobus sp.]
MSDEPLPPADQSPPTLPPPARVTEAEQVLARFVRERVGPAVSPMDDAIARRMKAEHVTQMFEFLKLREANRHTEATDAARHRPVMSAVVVFAVLGFVFCFAWLSLAYGKSEMVLPVVTGVTGLAAGAIGGYGYANSEKKTPPNDVA